MAITRLSGGTTPPNGSDPRTFPAIWNDAVDDIEALELPITADRIADGAVTAPKLAKTAGAVMVFDDATARATAIPTPVEGMTTYLKDTDLVEVFDGSDFVPVAIEPDPPAILQVVQTVKTDTFTKSGVGEVDIAGLNVTITPASATSKIQVSASFTTRQSASNSAESFRLFRGTTAIGRATGGPQLTTRIFATLSGAEFPVTFQFMDSPTTTSPITYKVTGETGSAGAFTIGAFTGAAISTITAMEVAG